MDTSKVAVETLFVIKFFYLQWWRNAIYIGDDHAIYICTDFHLHCASQSNSVCTHCCKRTFSRKRKRTLLRVKFEFFFFCSRALVGGHPMQSDWLSAVKSVLNLQINNEKTFGSTIEQWGSVLSSLHLSVGKQPIHSFNFNTSP